MHLRPAIQALKGPRLAPIPRRAIIAISGSDASRFLNGLIPAQVDDHKPFFSVFLNAQVLSSSSFQQRQVSFILLLGTRSKRCIRLHLGQ